MHEAVPRKLRLMVVPGMESNRFSLSRHGSSGTSNDPFTSPLQSGD